MVDVTSVILYMSIQESKKPDKQMTHPYFETVRTGHVVRPVSRFMTLQAQTNKLKTWAKSLFSVNTSSR